MSTRGAYGFRKNGIDKLSYNHSDSYPDCLGHKMSVFCSSLTIDELNKFCDAIVMVNEDDTPTPEQKAQYAEATDLSVSRGTDDEWYCVLRNLQGELHQLFRMYQSGITPYMIDNAEFIKDSLFCEYAYIINLDTDCLEYWVGFQRKPDPDNRYGAECCDGYYPCKLMLEFPLDGDFANAVDSMNACE